MYVLESDVRPTLVR